MSRDLGGKRIIVTGASSGIGKALAVELARVGANLVLAGRATERLDEVARSLNAAEVLTVPTDVRHADDRERLIRSAVDRFGGIDVLINNAGIASWGHFASSDESVMREIMEVNFFGPVELIRLAIPHLTDGIEPAIVNISSMCGR
jgi:short-subunit dehydrogenase